MISVTGHAAVGERSFDLCVIGAGPVGLAVATRAAATGMAVALMDSGVETPSSDRQELASARLVNDRHQDMRLAVARALGGTSWFWGGRCTPLDPVDFDLRPYLPDSGWPITDRDLSPYYADVAGFIGCADGTFRIPLDRESGLPAGLTLEHVERWCDEPRLTARINDLSARPNLTLILDATVVDLELCAEGSGVAALAVVSKDGPWRFSAARAYIIACGGLETARLLLHVQERWPQLFGGPQGPLGRYYMGHMSGKVASIRFPKPETADLFRYATMGGGIARRRLSFTRYTLDLCSLPNVIFYPANPLLGDPSHRSGTLSALFLALSVPVLGRRFVAEAIRRMQMTQEPHFLAHIRNILADAPAAAIQIYDILRQRLINGRRKPFVFLPSKSGVYPIHYHGEQAPSPSSRVRLGAERDATGLRRLEIDLRFSESDAEGIARAHRVLQAVLRTSHFAELTFDYPEEELAAAILRQARDGFHQMGVTRIGATPEDGVVDGECRVFGLDNLFVVGSGVFRTGGQANPTFSAVALAFRLADYLVKGGAPAA
jgi:choline dehydrogenase-like flavoprotein